VKHYREVCGERAGLPAPADVLNGVACTLIEVECAQSFRFQRSRRRCWCKFTAFRLAVSLQSQARRRQCFPVPQADWTAGKLPVPTFNDTSESLISRIKDLDSLLKDDDARARYVADVCAMSIFCDIPEEACRSDGDLAGKVVERGGKASLHRFEGQAVIDNVNAYRQWRAARQRMLTLLLERHSHPSLPPYLWTDIEDLQRDAKFQFPLCLQLCLLTIGWVYPFAKSCSPALGLRSVKERWGIDIPERSIMLGLDLLGVREHKVYYLCVDGDEAGSVFTVKAPADAYSDDELDSTEPPQADADAVGGDTDGDDGPVVVPADASDGAASDGASDDGGPDDGSSDTTFDWDRFVSPEPERIDFTTSKRIVGPFSTVVVKLLAPSRPLDSVFVAQLIEDIFQNRPVLSQLQAMLSHHSVQAFRNDQGHTLLHAAVHSKNADMVRLLLNWGADPNARDLAGRSPVWEAAAFGTAEILQLLLTHGGNVSEVHHTDGRRSAITILTNATRAPGSGSADTVDATLRLSHVHATQKLQCEYK
jgi:hypothetical protein